MEYQEIAQRLGVHRGTLFHWMSGNRSPSKLSMLKIEHELGWSTVEQFRAYNEVEVDDEGNPTLDEHGKPKDGYGPALRAFLEKKFQTPAAR